MRSASELGHSAEEVLSAQEPGGTRKSQPGTGKHNELQCKGAVAGFDRTCWRTGTEASMTAAAELGASVDEMRM